MARPDVIIATSPQLLVGLTGWWLARAKRVPFIFEVRDLWPESLSAVGVGGDTSWMVRLLGRLANFLYRASDHIVVVSPAFKTQLVERWKVDPAKISVVENGVEASLFSSNGAVANHTEESKFNGKFVVSYIGTLGNASGLEMALEAAKQLQHVLPKVLFLFVGEGAEKDRLIALAQRDGLRNVFFLPQQPRERIPSFIQESDICLVLLKKADVFKTVIPTKMLEFMACGRPVILGVDGQAREILEKAQAGIFIEPENSTELVRAIEDLYHNPGRRESLGCNGQGYVSEHLSRERLATVYSDILKRFVQKCSPQRATEYSK